MPPVAPAPAGRRTPSRWPVATRPPSPRSPRAVRASRTRARRLVALALADAPVDGRDERWLDLCAGPGGKAALLAALAAQRGAVLVANERQPHRAALVSSALRATPRGSAHVLAGDGMRPAWLPGTFDRVLVDAPCSGLGALRRRPESRWRRTPHDVEEPGRDPAGAARCRAEVGAPGWRGRLCDLLAGGRGDQRRRTRRARAPRRHRRGRPLPACGRTATAPTRCSRRPSGAGPDERTSSLTQSSWRWRR